MSKRELTGHQVNPANDVLRVTVADAPGADGANHRYEIRGFNTEENPSYDSGDSAVCDSPELVILFQNGPIAEAGVNGVTHEVLLAILIDRLEGFQSGQFANPYNQTALDACRKAQDALLQRTRERMSRGVEGTHTV